MEVVLSFLVAVAAGVVCHYVIKWLDSDKYSVTGPGLFHRIWKRKPQSWHSGVFALSSYMDLFYLFAYRHYSICNFSFQYANLIFNILFSFHLSYFAIACPCILIYYSYIQLYVRRISYISNRILFISFFVHFSFLVQFSISYISFIYQYQQNICGKSQQHISQNLP